MARNTIVCPHFGAYVAKRLSSLRPGTKDSKHLCIRGLVTILVDALDIPFPGLEGLLDPRLTIPIIAASRLFDQHRDGYLCHVHNTAFLLTPESRHLLDFTAPIEFTDWYFWVVTDESSRRGGISEDDDSDGPDHPATSSGAGHSHTTRSPPYPPYHQT
ncbi:hypothetical protein LXL04_007979 [Taraxacum kok-saghyz]